ncbi:MAG: NADase-type glycan-binding domain-containing protein [Myxococcales bacterium]
MKPLALALALLSPTSTLAAGAVGYARASSQLKVESRPTLYQPLNVLDGREISVWCEGAEGDGVGQKLVIGFKEEVLVDELQISTGDGKEPSTFAAHHRVKKLVVKEPRSVHRLTLIDERGPQSFKLDPPIRGDRVELEIAEVVKGTGDDDAACLSDVIFLKDGKPLNGPFLTDKLKYERGRAQLMNTWYAGPKGAPERFLDFYYDGTFHYLYRPFDPEEELMEVRGEYVFDRDVLKLKLPDKGWVTVQTKKEKVTTEDGVVQTVLQLTSEALEKSLATSYADEP